MFEADADSAWGLAPLAITRARATDGTLRLVLVGELDLSTVGLLAGALEASLHEGFIELDLSQLEFADLTGLRWVLDWLERSRDEGWTLEVAPQLSPQLARLVLLTGSRPLLWPVPRGPQGGLEDPEAG